MAFLTGGRDGHMNPEIVKLAWLTFGQQPIDRKSIRSALTGASLLVLGAFLAACSDVPDAVNPVSWYHGVEGWFEDDEAAPPPEVKTAGAAETATTPGEGKSFPSVNEVPDKPATDSTVEQRREMMQELGADKANAQYLEESQTVAVAKSAGGTEVVTETSTETQVAAAQTPAAGDGAPDAGEPPPPPSSSEPILDLDSPLPPAPMPPPLTEDTPPPPPPPAPAQAVTPASPGSGELDEVYEQKLQESAPTVSTAVAGPTAPVPGADAGGFTEGAMEDIPPPPRFAASTSPVVQAETQMATATMAPGFVGPSTQVATIYFGNNSAAIRDSEATKIRDVAAMYKERGGRLRVLGYASSRTADMDPVQHQMVNFAISVQRTDAVSRALVNNGVKVEDINATALSDSQPVYYESMPAGEAGNRRVEIFVDYY